MRERVRRWLPVALWALLVLGLGQGAFSADATGSRLLPLLRWIGLDETAAAAAHAALRKGAHVAEYAVLGFLAERAGSGALVAGAVALAVAATDEALQAQRPERTGAASDVALDAAGAALGIAWRARRAGRARGAGARAEARR